MYIYQIVRISVAVFSVALRRKKSACVLLPVPVSRPSLIDAGSRVRKCASSITCFTVRLEHAIRRSYRGLVEEKVEALDRC